MSDHEPHHIPQPNPGHDPQIGGWRFNKTIDLSHIVATLVLAASILAWGSKMESRVAVLESKQIAQDELMRTHVEGLSRDVSFVRKDVSDVGGKLDKLIDKMMSPAYRTPTRRTE